MIIREINNEELPISNSEPHWLIDKRNKAKTIFKQLVMPNFNYGLNISLSINLKLEELNLTLKKNILREIIHPENSIKFLGN